MSYNLLLDTNFTKTDKHWKLTNCIYENGYLKATDNIFSIEQEIILPDPTKVYFSMDYICFDKNIKSIYCGIFTENGELKVTKRKPSIRTRKRISTVASLEVEKLKIMFIIESKAPNSKIYIDSPLLIDLKHQGKKDWPRWVLNKCLDYRYGYDYENEYHKSEITLDNNDFRSPYTETLEANIGVIAAVKESDWFGLSHHFKEGNYYLIKLDYSQINEYGNIYFQYGEITSTPLGKDQLYIIFKANSKDNLRLKIENQEALPYLINLKHILVVNLTNVKLEEDDIAHLPFIK